MARIERCSGTCNRHQGGKQGEGERAKVQAFHQCANQEVHAFLSVALVPLHFSCWQVYGCSGAGICSSSDHGKSGTVSGRGWICAQEEELSAQSCSMDGCLGQVGCLGLIVLAWYCSRLLARYTGMQWLPRFCSR
jgi:hypothetical protein